MVAYTIRITDSFQNFMVRGGNMTISNKETAKRVKKWREVLDFITVTV
jgi:hypothetical protein